MKFATKLTLSTLMVAAGSAFIAPPAHADGRHTEQLNSQFQPSTRTRAEVAAEAREANRRGQLAPRTVHVDIPVHAPAVDMCLVVLEGQGEVVAGPRREAIGPGSIVIVAAGQDRGIKATTRLVAVHLVSPPPTEQDHSAVMAGLQRGEWP